MSNDPAHLTLTIHPEASVTPEASAAVVDLLRQMYEPYTGPLDFPPITQPIRGKALEVIVANALGAFPSTARSLIDDDWHGFPCTSTRPPGIVPLALNMIVKDGLTRGSDVERAILSVAPVCTELVVIDTGSTDGTVERVAGLRDRLPCTLNLLEQPWGHDFAEARNAAIEQTAAPYIIWLDADEELTIEGQAYVPQILQIDAERLASEDVAWMIQLVGYGLPGNVWRPRVFPNRPDLRWEYALHEDLVDSLVRIGVPCERLPCGIYHHSYADPEHREANNGRDQEVAMAQEAPELIDRGWSGSVTALLIAVDDDGGVEFAVTEKKPDPPPETPEDAAREWAAGSDVVHPDVLLNQIREEGEARGDFSGKPLELDADLSDAFKPGG